MSYEDVRDGIHERFTTVTGLQSSVLLGYEPKSVSVTPLIYSLLIDYERSEEGQVVTEGYRILHRLLFNWTEPEQAEEALVSYVNAIPLAVERDPQLDGRLSRGIAQIVSAKAGFTRIDGTVYRILDFTSESVERRPAERGD